MVDSEEMILYLDLFIAATKASYNTHVIYKGIMLLHSSNKDNNQINLWFEFSSAKLHSILTLPPAVPPTHSMKVYFQP